MNHLTKIHPGHDPMRLATMKSGRPIYHYTTGDRLMAILASGEIRPAHQNVIPPEIPAVWLSTASDWEHSATKGVIVDGVRREATLSELVRICGCLVRIMIDPQQVKLICPLTLRRTLRIPRTIHDRLLAAGVAMDANPSEWRAAAAPIPVQAFLRVEYSIETRPLRWLTVTRCTPQPVSPDLLLNGDS